MSLYLIWFDIQCNLCSICDATDCIVAMPSELPFKCFTHCHTLVIFNVIISKLNLRLLCVSCCDLLFLSLSFSHSISSQLHLNVCCLSLSFTQLRGVLWLLLLFYFTSSLYEISASIIQFAHFNLIAQLWLLRFFFLFLSVDTILTILPVVYIIRVILLAIFIVSPQFLALVVCSLVVFSYLFFSFFRSIGQSICVCVSLRLCGLWVLFLLFLFRLSPYFLLTHQFIEPISSMLISSNSNRCFEHTPHILTIFVSTWNDQTEKKTIA